MRFQFTIRDLLLVIVIAALVAGWWIDHQRINRLAVEQWEYRWDISYDANPPNMENQEGREGWEACGITWKPEAPGGGGVVILFKRPKR